MWWWVQKVMVKDAIPTAVKEAISSLGWTVTGIQKTHTASKIQSQYKCDWSYHALFLFYLFFGHTESSLLHADVRSLSEQGLALLAVRELIAVASLVVEHQL